MARGWESKAIADQMEEAEAHTPQTDDEQTNSPAVRARRERRETLRLSRARTLAQLENASAAAHRAMLQNALAALDAQIADLN